ncbi:MAG: ATP-binding protein [Sulfuritalea sp.]|nr:ATP-binding protein [Sulfuritalea sp.]MDP1983924.1 ATP-binding protein [Sulfuritalea sp.]
MRVNSLRHRVLLILVLTIVGIQVLSFGGIGAVKGFDARALRNEAIATDLAYMRQRLQELAPAERRLRAPQLRRGAYGFELLPVAQALPEASNSELRMMLESVQRLAAPQAVKATVVHLRGAPALRVSLDADDDMLVSFDEALGSTRPSWPGVLLYVLAVTALVSLIAWQAVLMATRPLDDFTLAADRLARDLDMPSLPMTGPTEVKNAALAFNAMHAEVRRQLDERSQILAAISHDLKTPLTRLKLRLAKLDPSEQTRLIEADVDAMAALIEEGLDYARSRQLRETKVPVNLNHLLQDIVDQATDLGHDCQLAGHCMHAVPAAPRALERLLQNVVDNALRHATQVRIELRESVDSVEVQVCDNGPGLAAELLEKVFEPYFRAESSRSRDTGGTGLGLSIARNLAQAHGGRIWLQPATPHGLVVHIWLPTILPDVPAAASDRGFPSAAHGGP